MVALVVVDGAVVDGVVDGVVTGAIVLSVSAGGGEVGVGPDTASLPQAEIARASAMVNATPELPKCIRTVDHTVLLGPRHQLRVGFTGSMEVRE